MSCRDAINLIHDELDGTASAESRRRLHEHLAACAGCAREYEAFVKQEALLRELDPEEPSLAYYEAMAQSIARETRRRERQPMGGRVPSWAFSSALAAACLLIGLSVGRVALPKTVTRTETVVRRVEVPGPVREVEVERVVVKEVPVPVEVVRTRTVVRRVPVAAAPVRPSVSLAAETPAAATPSTRPVLTRETRRPTDDLGLGAPPAGPGDGLRYGMAFADHSIGHGTSRLTSSDLRLIASRLRSDMSGVDVALGTPTLAATLVSDMERAGTVMGRSLSAEPAAAATSSEDTR